MSLLSFSDAKLAINKMIKQSDAKSENSDKIKILSFCISFAENQLGERFTDIKDRLHIDLIIKIPLYLKLSLLFIKPDPYAIVDNVYSKTVLMAINNVKKTIPLLTYWRNQVDLEKNKIIVYINNNDIDVIYSLFSDAKNKLAVYYEKLSEYSKAIKFSEHAILYARQIISEKSRVHYLYSALDTMAVIFHRQHKYTEAKPYFEEAYITVSYIYSLDHPYVLHAGNNLIKVLTDLKEYYDVERYARLLYECQFKSNTESEEFATVIESLAEVTSILIIENGPIGYNIEEAEMLARKALAIKSRIYGSNHILVVNILTLLADILRVNKNECLEAKILLEQALNILIVNGIDNARLAHVNFNLGLICLIIAIELQPSSSKNEQLIMAESYYKESIRINSKLFSSNYPQICNANANLLVISSLLLDSTK
jgi:tetratricopeptide (TPR) repeat protein